MFELMAATSNVVAASLGGRKAKGGGDIMRHLVPRAAHLSRLVQLRVLGKYRDVGRERTKGRGVR